MENPTTHQISDPKTQESSDEIFTQTTHNDAFAFSASEQLILDRYDEEQELQLEIALLKAQGQPRDLAAISDDVLDEQLIIAEREALEARAEYLLRNKVTQSILAIDPVLKTVHGGANITDAERRLLPMVNERDVISMYHSTLESRLSSTLSALAAAEKGSLIANEKNKELSQILLELAEETKSQSTDEVEDPKLRERLQSLDKDVKLSRRRWRILKSIISGMIVGSGVEWADDNVLRELVMDDEDGLD
ncbi:hypothetical protein BU16DRAFT_557265 [Lophium mytilinum]|uniref:Centromere protein H C-terminal domain-containing protein n=1 Tax=Lophium mytilinum TaxID=390894 RepID=A0A6A6RBI0_9PEZI|nr:hypothetical protein BU16DRAFT_557265 [Lophium mytilinum]